MNKTEIVNEYRHAKNKRAQIGILAELNACSKEHIEAILIEGGVELPRRPGPQPHAGKQASCQPRTPNVVDVLHNELAKLESEYSSIPAQIRALQERLVTLDARRTAIRQALELVIDAYEKKEDTHEPND